MTKAPRRGPRRLAFVIVALLTATTLLAGAQAKKGGKPPAVAPAKKPAAKPAATAKPAHDYAERDAGSSGASAAGASERAPVAAASGKDAGPGAVLEQKGSDGGVQSFRFGEIEVEGRLKSPQIVYFLRRVRAEFAAGDLGHRTFMRELSETRNEPEF